MADYISSDNAKCLFQGKAKLKSYSASSTTNPALTLTDLDDDQFYFLMTNLETNSTVRLIMGFDSEMVWNLDMQAKGVYDNKSGRTVQLKFIYDQSLIDTLRLLKGKVVDCHIIEGVVVEKPKKEKGSHGKYAAQLVTSQLMISKSFWECVGSEERYLDWLRGQPCMITGTGVENEAGEKRCEAAHVRDIKYGAGIAKKPEYFAVPLHPKEHAKQHEKGVYNMWKSAGRPTHAATCYPIQSNEHHIRQWLVLSVFDYIREWIMHEIKEYFDVDSMSFIGPDIMDEYLRDKCSQEMSDKFKQLIDTPRSVEGI